MLTRSKAKLQQPRSRKPPRSRPPPDKSVKGTKKLKRTVKKKSNRGARLTEDLLYIVNKKLRKMHNSARNQILQDYMLALLPVPFTEIVYRKRKFEELSETELAVMHMVNYNANSTAVCKLNSMSQFLNSVNRAGRLTNWHFYSTFLNYTQGDAAAPVVNPPARFIQLPKDYFRPHSDCSFFGELAWKEGGVMMVEADKFALCMIIWKLKDWLVDPINNSYPLSCGWAGPGGRLDCSCQNLLRAMWTDDRLRNILQDETIFQGIDIYIYDDDQSLEAAQRARYAQLQLVYDQMEGYAGKLITGEEMICRSNRALNVLSASQLQKMLEKLESIINCFERHHTADDEW